MPSKSQTSPRPKPYLVSRLESIKKTYNPKTTRTLTSRNKCDPDLRINLSSDFFMGAFIHTGQLSSLEAAYQRNLSVAIASQCVPFSVSILAKAIALSSSYSDTESIDELTGLGNERFSRDEKVIISKVFPGIDISDDKCVTGFSSKELYHSSSNINKLPQSILSEIIRPFLKRYPCKRLIETRSNGHLIIPFGYIMKTTKAQQVVGHQLLLVLHCDVLYTIEHSDKQLLEHMNTLVF